MNPLQPSSESAELLFRKHGGMLRVSEAVALGIHPRILYRLRDENRLVLCEEFGERPGRNLQISLGAH